MLVLKRRNGQWLNVRINLETLKRLVEEGREPELRFRVYNISENPARVDIAFDDAERNFEIERPERLKAIAVNRDVF